MKKLVKKITMLCILLMFFVLISGNKVSVEAATQHRIEVGDSTYGVISVDMQEATAGDFVRVTVNPDSGYALDDIQIKDVTGKIIQFELKDDKYQFTMPNADVTVQAKFTKGYDFSFPGAETFEILNYGTLKVWNEKGIEISPYVTATGSTPKNNKNIYCVPKGKMTYAIYDMNFEEYQKEQLDIAENTSVYYEKLTFDFNPGLGDKRKDTGLNIEVKDFSGKLIKPLSWTDAIVNGENKGYLRAVFFMKRTETAFPSSCECSYTVSVEKRYTLGGGATSNTLTYKMRRPNSYMMSNTKVEFNIVGDSESSADMKFAVPKEANAKLYFHNGKAYAEKTVLEPTTIDTTSNETYDIYTFRSENGKYAWLVCGGEGTPYKRTAVDVALYATNEPITIDLKKKDEKSEDNSLLEEDDLYTNIKENYLTMQVGDSHRLEGFRVTQTVLSVIGNDYIDPQMHYEIIAGDSVELKSEGSIGREYQTMRAVKTGISVIKITYDDLDIQNVMMQNPDNSRFTFYCNPIDPINTGIVVVNVGGSEEGIDTGIKLTDFDTVFIPEKTILPDDSVVKGEETVPYTFKPESTKGSVRVTVHDPIQIQSDWNSGWTELQPDAEGKYTTALKEGRNIVCIESGDSIVYRLINAKKLTTTVKNETRNGRLPQVGDDVTVSFEGLELPVYKMCGIYNPGYPDRTWVDYRLAENGEQIQSQKTQYAIEHSNAIKLHIENEADLVLNSGHIYCEHLGSPLYAHCDISLEGAKPNLNATTGKNSPYFDILPDITIPVVGKEVGVIALINEIDTTDYLGCVDKIMEAQDAYDALTDEEKAKVTNADVLHTAYEAVKDIIDVIRAVAALPDEVTLADRAAVEAANAAYLALAPERQAVVSNASRLKAAVETMQALVVRQERIDSVIAQIGALPVTDKLVEDDAQAVQDARAAYEALAEDEKAEVTNLDTLEMAEQQIGYLKEAREVSEKIEAIGTVDIDTFEEAGAKIVAARTAYDLLDDAAKALVTNVDTLKAAEETYKLTDEDVQAVIQAIRVLETPLAASEPDMTDEALAEVWDDYSYVVVNIRGLADRLTESQQKLIPSLDELEQAEDYLARLQAAKGAKEAAAAYDEAKKLLSEDTLPKAGDYTGENPKELTTEDVDAVVKAKTAFDALDEAQQAALTEELKEAVENLTAMDELLKGSEGTKDYYEKATADTVDQAVTEAFVKELADVYATYKDATVTRSDVEVINRTLAQYDALSDSQKEIVAEATIDEQMAAGLLGALHGWSDQVKEDESAAQEVTDYIKSLPTSLNMDNRDAVRTDLEAIEKMYDGLNAQAKTYVRRLSKAEAVSRVLQTLNAEIDAFEKAVTGVNAGTVTDSTVALSWNTVEYAKSYEVYRKGADGQWTKLAETTGTSYSDQSAAASTAYSYRVIAVTDHWGQRVESSFVEIRVTTAATPAKPDTGNSGNTNETTPAVSPDAPVLTAVSAGYNSVRLGWKKVSGADGYRIYRATSANGTYKAVATLKKGKSTSYTDKKLTTGKVYYYRIRAYRNQNGKKVWKTYSKSVSVIPALGSVKVTKAGTSGKKAVLKWKKVSGASGYLIYRSASKDGGYKCVNSLSSRKANYTSKSLAKGTYYYKIRAYRKVGGRRVYSPYTAARKVRVK